jgi:hypothetical protein
MADNVLEGVPSPRVFVSYTHESEHHRDRVLELAETLRSFGVDARIDRYSEVPPPTSWPAWMHDEIDAADFVLVVCSEAYERRLLGRESPGSGLGVRWEGAIITQQSYEEDTRRFVPVVLDPKDQSHIPYFLRSTTHYSIDVESRRGLEPLLRHILDEPEVSPAPLGVRPAFPLAPALKANFEGIREMRQLGVSNAIKSADFGSKLSFAADAAIRASEAVQAGSPLDEALLHLRESLQAFASGLSLRVGARCRVTIYGLEASNGSADIVPVEEACLTVRPIATSAPNDPRAPKSERLFRVRDLNEVFLRRLTVYVNNNLKEGTYSNPYFAPMEPAYAAAMVWPIVRRSHRDPEIMNMLGFLAVDSVHPDIFDVDRDEPLGALYAGLLSFVLQDLSREHPL